MIVRPKAMEALELALDGNPIAVLLGPRQCGKTTLARDYAHRRPSTFFDLEKPSDRAKLQTPELVLESLSGLIVIDEV
jgi:predicted AAA+ superfamily ATPase